MDYGVDEERKDEVEGSAWLKGVDGKERQRELEEQCHWVPLGISGQRHVEE